MPAAVLNNPVDGVRMPDEGDLSRETMLHICGIAATDDEYSDEVGADLDAARTLVSSADASRNDHYDAIAVLVTGVLAHFRKHNPTHLPFGYDGPASSSPGWVERETVETVVTQAMGLRWPDCPAQTLAFFVSHGISNAKSLKFLQESSYDAWRPGMASGAGWRSVVSATAFGLQKARAAARQVSAREVAAAAKPPAPKPDAHRAKAPPISNAPATAEPAQGEADTKAAVEELLSAANLQDGTLPAMTPADAATGAQGLLLLLAQAYYHLLESAVAGDFAELDLQLNHHYLWVVQCIQKLLSNEVQLRDFPEPFEPALGDLYPTTVRDVDWQDMIAPRAEGFLSAVQKYTLHKGFTAPQKGSLPWTFIELFRPAVERALEAATAYSKRVDALSASAFGHNVAASTAPPTPPTRPKVDPLRVWNAAETMQGICRRLEAYASDLKRGVKGKDIDDDIKRDHLLAEQHGYLVVSVGRHLLLDITPLLTVLRDERLWGLAADVGDTHQLTNAARLCERVATEARIWCAEDGIDMPPAGTAAAAPATPSTNGEPPSGEEKPAACDTADLQMLAADANLCLQLLNDLRRHYETMETARKSLVGGGETWHFSTPGDEERHGDARRRVERVAADLAAPLERVVRWGKASRIEVPPAKFPFKARMGPSMFAECAGAYELAIRTILHALSISSLSKAAAPVSQAGAESQARAYPKLVLNGLGEPYSIDGKEKPKLSDARYAVVKALLEAGREGMKKDAIEAVRPSARQIIKALLEDDDWKPILQMAEGTNLRYRIMQ